MMAAKLLVNMAVMMMATAAFRRHWKRRGEGAPSSSSSLTSSLDGRMVSPLVLGLHGMGGVRAPQRVDLSLSGFAFSDSALSPFLIYPEIHNSDWIRGSGVCPHASWPPRAPSHVDFSSQKS